MVSMASSFIPFEGLFQKSETTLRILRRLFYTFEINPSNPSKVSLWIRNQPFETFEEAKSSKGVEVSHPKTRPVEPTAHVPIEIVRVRIQLHHESTVASLKYSCIMRIQ
jgi:hypothetical protein